MTTGGFDFLHESQNHFAARAAGGLPPTPGSVKPIREAQKAET